MENDTELDIEDLGTDLPDEPDNDKDPADKEIDGKTYNDEDVDKIVQKKLARAKKEYQRELDKLKDEADDGDLSEAEQLRKKVDEYEQRETRRQREGDVRTLFTDSGINAPDNVVAALIRGDEDETLDAVDAVLDLVKQEVQNVKKQQGRRTPPADPSATKKTKELSIGERLAKRNASKNGKAFE